MSPNRSQSTVGARSAATTALPAAIPRRRTSRRKPAATAISAHTGAIAVAGKWPWTSTWPCGYTGSTRHAPFSKLSRISSQSATASGGIAVESISSEAGRARKWYQKGIRRRK